MFFSTIIKFQAELRSRSIDLQNTSTSTSVRTLYSCSLRYRNGSQQQSPVFTRSHCGFAALLKGTLNHSPSCCRPSCRRAGPSGAGSPLGAPMLLFPVLIRLAAAATKAMRLPCRTGEHSHALQAPSRRPRGREHTHTYIYIYTVTTPAGSLKKKKKTAAPDRK